MLTAPPRASSSSVTSNSSGSKPIARASSRNTSVLLFASPSGRDRRFVRLHVQVAVAAVDVEVLQLRRRRQHDVGVVGRVGLKLLVDDGEQVLALQPLEHACLIRADRGGVGVVDVQRPHRRPGQLAVQRLGELHHVDGARARRNQVGPLQSGAVEGVQLARAEQSAAAGVSPGADDRRQTGDGRTAMPPPPCRCKP